MKGNKYNKRLCKNHRTTWDHFPAHPSPVVSPPPACILNLHTNKHMQAIHVSYVQRTQINGLDWGNLEFAEFPSCKLKFKLKWLNCIQFCGSAHVSSWSESFTCLSLLHPVCECFVFRHRQEDIQDTKDDSCPFRPPFLEQLHQGR